MAFGDGGGFLMVSGFETAPANKAVGLSPPHADEGTELLRVFFEKNQASEEFIRRSLIVSKSGSVAGFFFMKDKDGERRFQNQN